MIQIEKKFVDAKKLKTKNIINGIKRIIKIFTKILTTIKKTIHQRKKISFIFLITSQLDAFIDQKTDLCSIIKNWLENANKKFTIIDKNSIKIKNGIKIQTNHSQKFLAKKLHSEIIVKR